MLEILATLNEWSLGQIWDNLIIVQGRTTFEDEKVARACEEGEALIEDTRGIDGVQDKLVKRSEEYGWQIPTIDYESKEIVSLRPFNRLDANKVPVYVVNAYMANKCWNSPERGMEQCWKLPKMERDGNFLPAEVDSSSISNSSNGLSDSSSDWSVSSELENSGCAFDNPPKYIFIEEAKQLVNKMKEMKTKPMFPSWKIYETDLKNDIRKFNNLTKRISYTLHRDYHNRKFTITAVTYYGPQILVKCIIFLSKNSVTAISTVSYYTTFSYILSFVANCQ